MLRVRLQPSQVRSTTWRVLTSCLSLPQFCSLTCRVPNQKDLRQVPGGWHGLFWFPPSSFLPSMDLFPRLASAVSSRGCTGSSWCYGFSPNPGISLEQIDKILVRVPAMWELPMNKSQIIALYNQDQRKAAEFPSLRREVTPEVVDRTFKGELCPLPVRAKPPRSQAKWVPPNPTPSKSDGAGVRI